MLELAREHRVTLIAYSPLAQGILTGRFHDDPSRVKTLSWGRRSPLGGSGKFLTPEGLARTAPLIASCAPSARPTEPRPARSPWRGW